MPPMVTLSGKFGKGLKSPRGVLLRRPDSIKQFFLLRAVSPYTMVWHDSLMQMADLIRRVDRKGVEGAIVETGCWRGGCSAFMAAFSRKNGSKRQTWMFDSFEGLPEPGVKDQQFFEHMRVADVASFKEALAADETKAHEVVKKLHLGDQTHIVKGWFKDTLPTKKQEIGKIAILRLDGDLYDSTMVVLEELYDQLALGGYVVIDDYVFEGVRHALYDFFQKRGIAPFLEENTASIGNKRVRTFFEIQKTDLVGKE